VEIEDIADQPPEFVSVPSITRISEDVPRFTEVGYKGLRPEPGLSSFFSTDM
jgi:hypothetical protein